jgi:hypothetical protein
MTHSNHDHIDVEQLNDFVDDRLPPDERARVAAHLSYCPSCSEQLARLRLLLNTVRALPDEMAPPDSVWESVLGSLTSVPISRRRLASRWWLAAAAVLLVAVSSAVTALLVRRQPIVVVREIPVPVANASITLPPPARSIDADYAAAIRELDETLAERRSQLDPATIAKVEQSLHVIDLAIGEARRALADDPANRTLLDILAANYERKVELLRRASELSSTI